MNEMIVIEIGTVSFAASIIIALLLWLVKSNKNDDYIKNSEYIIDDFYTFSKEKRR